MIMRKKMKTKFDYQARTFGACVILLLSFTLMFISPALDRIKDDNTTILQSIEKLEDEQEVNLNENGEFNRGVSDESR